MRKIKAFTLIEVMISIFIFTTAMLGYMSFHAYSASVLFDNESAQFAHSLAFNLVDEINSMSYESFFKLTSNDADKGGFAFSRNTKIFDWEVKAKDSDLFGTDFAVSPFNIFGKHDENASYRFYRAIRIDSYTNKTQTYAQTGSYLSTLYHVDVLVFWPKKGYPDADCSNYNETACNMLSIPIVRSNEDFK